MQRGQDQEGADLPQQPRVKVRGLRSQTGQARDEGAAGSGAEAERSSSEKTERYIEKAASMELVRPVSMNMRRALATWAMRI